ncbi:MAG: DUF3369 domain-containing protein [Gammaproteobacteria bacterium]|nr:DUF3369 domain-containing protein [Gammaproteobacteria bacterium]
MKIIRKNKTTTAITSVDKKEEQEQEPLRHVWKVLIVDDEPDIHEITKLNLKDFRFEERQIDFLQASSAEQAKSILSQHQDIALALIDVVMETDDAGLKLVEYIRDQLKNHLIRVVIRTGQPGLAPERYVIDHFDIDDYKDKTELTTQKLYTTVRSAIKAYRDLMSIEMNRRGLVAILDATPKIYADSRQSLQCFFQGMLTQIVALYNLNSNAIISTLDGMVATIDGEQINIRAGTGEFENPVDNKRVNELIEACSETVISEHQSKKLRQNAMVITLTVDGNTLGFIYLEPNEKFNNDDLNLIKLFANQCSAVLESVQLSFDLKRSYNHAIDMLANVAEFRDSSTGNHINRLSMYTTIISLAMNYTDEQSEQNGQAARLHDVGKVGISDDILLKKGPLSDKEFEKIKTHTTLGEKILGGDEQFKLAADVALYHHERWDGTGYPLGLKGEEINKVARIVSVVDVFDALISKRSYKEAWAYEEAIEEIKRGSGSQFDPQIVDIFIDLYQSGRFDNIIKSMAD